MSAAMTAPIRITTHNRPAKIHAISGRTKSSYNGTSRQVGVKLWKQDKARLSYCLCLEEKPARSEGDDLSTRHLPGKGRSSQPFAGERPA